MVTQPDELLYDDIMYINLGDLVTLDSKSPLDMLRFYHRACHTNSPSGDGCISSYLVHCVNDRLLLVG